MSELVKKGAGGLKSSEDRVIEKKVDSRSDLLEKIRQGKKLKKVKIKFQYQFSSHQNFTAFHARVSHRGSQIYFFLFPFTI